MNQVDISQALEASTTAYGLLIWLGDLVNGESVSPSDARQILSSGEAAQQFLSDHAASIPVGLRSAADELSATAAILGSYLTVSFDLAHEAASERRPDPVCGPGCPWCWHVDKMAHLTTKKPTRMDHKRAESLMLSAVTQRANAAKSQISDAAIETVLSNSVADAAVAAYADDLVGRASGRMSGPWALVLWRKFAWSGGSPRKDFRLTADVIVGAEERLAAALAAPTA